MGVFDWYIRSLIHTLLEEWARVNSIISLIYHQSLQFHSVIQSQKQFKQLIKERKIMSFPVVELFVSMSTNLKILANIVNRNKNELVKWLLQKNEISMLRLFIQSAVDV